MAASSPNIARDARVNSVSIAAESALSVASASGAELWPTSEKLIPYAENTAASSGINTRFTPIASATRHRRTPRAAERGKRRVGPDRRIGGEAVGDFLHPRGFHRGERFEFAHLQRFGHVRMNRLAGTRLVELQLAAKERRGIEQARQRECIGDRRLRAAEAETGRPGALPTLSGPTAIRSPATRMIELPPTPALTTSHNENDVATPSTLPCRSARTPRSSTTPMSVVVPPMSIDSRCVNP